MAASAVPGAFPPVDVEGTLLVDGGLTSRAPVLEALEADPSVRRAIVVMSYAPDEGGARPSTLRRALEEGFEMAMIHQIRRDTELARLKNPGAAGQVLTPPGPPRVGPLDSDTAGIAALLELGGPEAPAGPAAGKAG